MLQSRLHRPLQPAVPPQQLVPQLPRPARRCRGLHRARYLLPVSELPDLVLERLIPGTMLSGLITGSSFVMKELSRQAMSNALMNETCRVMNLQGSEELQDTLAALVLSECVYKKVEMSNEDMVAKISEFLADFPPELVHLEAVQCSLNDLPQNYLVAVGSKSVYVAFMGTKQARDMLTDAAFFHEAIWTERTASSSRSASSSSASNQVPTAHRGFLARSKSIDVEALYQMALDSNRHLVLCGHSLGGAVAKLCTLRLLRKLPEWPPPQLRCICFAAPAVGNTALAQAVEAAGWDSFFKTYALPEDQLMQVLTQWWHRPMGSPSTPPTAAAAAAAAAIGGGGAAAAAVAGTPAAAAAAAVAAMPAAAPAAAGAIADLAVAGSAISSGSRAQQVQQAAGGQDEQEPPSSRSGSRSSSPEGGGQAAVSAVVNVLALPFRRESAKQQLRRELQAEERSTTPLDAAALDAADASAGAASPTSAAAPTTTSSSSSSSTCVPAGMSYDEPGPALLGLADLEAAAAKQPAASRAAAIEHRRPQQLQQEQEQGEGEAAVAAGTTATTGSSLSSSARSALTVLGAQVGAVPGNMALLLDLQRKWAGYQLTRMGQAAQDSFSTASQVVSRPVPFGQQWYLTSAGAVPLVPLPPRAYQPTSPDAQDFLAKHPGLLSFHRMVAYRSRSLALIQLVRTMLEQQGLKMPPPPDPSSSALRPPLLLAPVIPGLQVLGAAVRLPLGGPRRGGVDSSSPPPGTATTGPTSSSGSSGGWRSSLAFLPGGRKTEELVGLTVVVRGLNLHQAKYMSLSVFGETYIPVDSSQASAAPLPAPSSSRRAGRDAAAATATATSSSSAGGEQGGDRVGTGRLGRFAAIPAVAYVAKGVQQAGVALSRITEGGRPAWRQPPNRMVELQLRVHLPVSVVERLCAGTAAATTAAAGGSRRRGGAPAGNMKGRRHAGGRWVGAVPPGGVEGLENSSGCGWRFNPSTQQQQQQQRGLSSAVGAALGSPQPQQQQQQPAAVPALLLQLRSDFETVGVEVAVAPWKVGVVGTTPTAALALQQLLSGAAVLQPASALSAEELLAGVAQQLQGPAALLQPLAGAVQAAAAKLWSSAQRRGGWQQQQPVQAAQGIAAAPQPLAPAAQLGTAAAANSVVLPAVPQQQQQQQDVSMGDVVDNLPRSLSPQWVEPWFDAGRSRPAMATAAPAGGLGAPMGASSAPQGVLDAAAAAPSAADQAGTVSTAADRDMVLSGGSSGVPLAASSSSGEEVQPPQQLSTWWQRLASGSAVQTVAVAQAVRLVNHATGRAVHLPKRLLQERLALQAVHKKQRLTGALETPAAGFGPAGGPDVSAVGSSSRREGDSQAVVGSSIPLPPPASVSSSAEPMEGVVPSPALVRWGGGSSSSDSRLGAGWMAHPLRPLRQPGPGIHRRPGVHHSGRMLLRRGRGLAVAAPGGGRGRYRSDLRSTAVAALHAVDLLEGPAAMEAAVAVAGGAAYGGGGSRPQARGGMEAAAVQGSGAPQPQLLQQLASTVGGAAAGLAGGVQSAVQRAGTALRSGNSWGNLGAASAPGGAMAPPDASPAAASAAAATTVVLPGAPHVLVGVLYEPLPHAASAAARPQPHTTSPGSSSSHGAPPQRSGWWPLLGRRRQPPPPSLPAAAAPCEATPQQVLRLAARQLLRSQASSWSWAGLHGWAPRAVKGLVGVVSTSWSQRDIQPACDAWSAWKGGVLKLAGVAGGSQGGSRAVGLAAAAAALPSGVLEGQQQLYLQQRLEAAAQVEGARVAVAGSQSWDVLLLVAPWDATFPALLAEPALGALVSAAEAAGVPLVPVLVQQGPEEVVLVSQPLKGASAAAQRRAQAGRLADASPASSMRSKRVQSQQVAWRWEEAAGQLAEACGVPVTAVCQVQLGRPMDDVVSHPGDLSSRLSAHQQMRLQEQLQQVSQAVAAHLDAASSSGAAAQAPPPRPRSRL